MDQKYIKEKWQKYWEDSSAFVANNNSQKPKYYILDMFPYPSGNGLHVGHAVGYIGSDIIARKKRMSGFNVLHPMGWDAFGLPAEQFAIKTGISPQESTKTNCDNFRRQLKNMGLSYDWRREISTCEESYYKWTQFLFLKLYDRGLIYESEQYVWWCEELKTVLANEEVIDGKSERGDYPCIRKPLKQWTIKITKYAERLLEDLNDLDWPESIKKMQREWIGKSTGTDIKFDIVGVDNSLKVFTTKPETIYGVNAVIISPEHPNLSDLMISLSREEQISRLNKVNSASVESIVGVHTGSVAIHPMTKEKLPVLISNYVLSSYGQGAVMCVPVHDDRDRRLSQSMGLPSTKVIETDDQGEELLVNSSFLTGLTPLIARNSVTKFIEENELGEVNTRYRLHDWIFSRQRYWGEPIPLYKDKSGKIIPASLNELPITLPKVESYLPTKDGKSPLLRETEWVIKKTENGEKLTRVTDTMPSWAGSCWYYLRFMDPKNDVEPFSEAALEYWKEVDLYIGGAAHATMHLLYARFWHKVLYDIGLVSFKEPFRKLFNQGLVTADAFQSETGRIIPVDETEVTVDGYVSKKTGEKLEVFHTKMSKSLLNVVTPETVINKYGVDTFRLYMMFIGPLGKSKKWQYNSIKGCERLVNRIYSIYSIPSNKLDSGKVELIDNAWKIAFNRVDRSFKNFNFNTAVAAFMEFINVVEKNENNISPSTQRKLLITLYPFAPHICCELWTLSRNLGHVYEQKWPQNSSQIIKRIKLMINGKFISFHQKEEDEETMLSELRESLEGKKIKRIIHIYGGGINVLTDE
ncbi:leucine--tRNA ligase [Candidatus Enterovibrio escicola]|uniref:Leucine--tRNA ligase n=1 Tax=Candidatus Enterovibrio escicola TaxID=1927127 RepID=A0A2A5SZQ7_9GAMM|nr:leucine--tRNA ligase [Candidatus Enterovibrio escacola]PCS21394.1 Leucyl-tRNA synthetase [Candidatus Enterovibrio escacola]